MKNIKYSRLRMGLLGMILICMLGACNIENGGESDDGSLHLVEAVSEQEMASFEESMSEPVNTSELDSTPAPLVEEMSTPEAIVEPTIEPTNTPEATSEPAIEPSPTSEVIPEFTKEPASTPEVTSEPTVEPIPTSEVTQEPTSQPTINEDAEPENATAKTDYVLNKNTKKFHYSSCSSVKQMKDKNKKFYTGTREECLSMGYDPCGKCKP